MGLLIGLPLMIKRAGCGQWTSRLTSGSLPLTHHQLGFTGRSRAVDRNPAFKHKDGGIVAFRECQLEPRASL